ncbi:Uncharacterised protein [Acetobacterium wieringae]|uniref:hypothetical protein n=1 Tax=Acetobacterium wieringae TaxID=52694 RepID=UPI001D2C6A71|nr:hypothetical protein [Acetobacterium wieringae]VUZ26853.1 Uncharacterised protein [Acetobacterium wieringae]
MDKETVTDVVGKIIKQQQGEVERTAKREKRRYVYIDPDSYIGKEILYQSVLLKKLEDQNMEIIMELKRIEWEKSRAERTEKAGD